MAITRVIPGANICLVHTNIVYFIVSKELFLNSQDNKVQSKKKKILGDLFFRFHLGDNTCVVWRV